jgi:hypothetical protein
VLDRKKELAGTGTERDRKLEQREDSGEETPPLRDSFAEELAAMLDDCEGSGESTSAVEQDLLAALQMCGHDVE